MELEEVWVLVGIGEYEVSNFGRVMNGSTGKDLKPVPNKKGYLKVALHHGGKRQDAFVHRLVARAFFLNYEQGRQVRHKNGNRSDNTVLNLTLGVGCRKAVDGRL